MAKQTFTVPEVPDSKRTSERTYTHAVIGRRDGRCSAVAYAADMAVNEPRSRKWDGKHWDDYQRAAKATVGQPYRNPNGFLVEARDYEVRIGSEFIAANPDRDAYVEAQAAGRQAYLARLQASTPSELQVLQWSMSFQNAMKSVASHQKHHSEVRVVECQPVTKDKP